MSDSSTALLAATATAHDVAVGRLVLLARAVAESRLAPRGHGMAAGCRRALATAVRVVDRVHRRAARLRALAQVTRAAGLADRDVLVVGVANGADGRTAVRRDQSHLTGVEAQRCRPGLLRDELDGGAGGAAELAAAAGVQLHVVDDRTGRDVGQRECVAGADVGTRARGDHVADLHARRRQDVALLAVRVVQQRDVGSAVRVVLDRRDLGRHAVLATLEVDLAVAPLRAAAAMTGRDAAVRVAATGLRDALDQRLLGLRPRDLLEVGPRRETTAGAGGLVLLERHYSPVPSNSSIESSACSWTTAFFHSRVRPAVTPRRFGFERTLTVRTSSTRTPKISSTAWRTCVLFASGWMRNVYLLAASSA